MIFALEVVLQGTRPRLLFALCLAAGGVFNAAAATRPNIVMILSDDQGWGDLGFTGNIDVSTPNIDSLATSGAVFDRFFVCPICATTRAEVLTGRYHTRSGVRPGGRGATGAGERMNLNEHTIAQMLKAAGYATGAFGKWHNGSQYPYHPNARGFDEFYGFAAGHWANYFDATLQHNGTRVKGRGFIVDDLTDRALEFIEANQSGPFFCYVPFNTPHTPLQVPERFFKKFALAEIRQRTPTPGDEDLAFTRAVLAMTENIDWNVGRILRRLDELRIADNTIVIYFSDNGPNSLRWNGGMKGRKTSTDEGGVRSPFVIRWPGEVAPGTRIAQIAGAIDLLPTLAECAGIPPGNTKPLDGISLVPLLQRADVESWPDRMIFSHQKDKVSVRMQRYRLDHTGALYDLTSDPGQERNIAAKQPELTARLVQAVQAWRKEAFSGDWAERWPSPVGYREFPVTELEAAQAVPHGNVERSAVWPSASYFSNWISTSDRIIWDVDVATAGRYTATVYYTCAAADVGSTIELSLGPDRVEATLNVPHDPPLRGKEHDRVPRGEQTYAKDFKPFVLGSLDLKAGRGELALRALRVAGGSVMDIQAVVLELQR